VLTAEETGGDRLYPLRRTLEAVLVPAAALLALVLAWTFRATRLGLTIRIVGGSADAARAMDLPIDRIRTAATAAGSALAVIGGAFLSLSLSLSYPGSWNEGLSFGQGLMAVALVVFARWNPLACIGAALLFGAAGALGPSLQTVGVTQGYYLFYAAPYVLTLLTMALTVFPGRTPSGVPGELSVVR
jgi:general nucleoside transport system permease protein